MIKSIFDGTHKFSDATIYTSMFLMVIVFFGIYADVFSKHYALSVTCIGFMLFSLFTMLWSMIFYRSRNLGTTNRVRNIRHKIFFKTSTIYNIVFVGLITLSKQAKTSFLLTAYSIFIFIILFLTTKYANDEDIHEINNITNGPVIYFVFSAKHPWLYKVYQKLKFILSFVALIGILIICLKKVFK